MPPFDNLCETNLQFDADFLIQSHVVPEFASNPTNSMSSPIFWHDSQNRSCDSSSYSYNHLKENDGKFLPVESFDSFLLGLGDEPGLNALEEIGWDEDLALPLSSSLEPWSNPFESQASNLQPSIENRNADLDTNSPILTENTTKTSTSSTTTFPPETPISNHPSSNPIPNNQYWHAVSTRSHAADGSFVYGVLSTGIYCRPSCPSRRPSRTRIRFFPNPGAIEAAETAKFRACKRCKPQTAGTANAGVRGINLALEKIAREVDCWPPAAAAAATAAVSATMPSREEQESTKLETLARTAGLSVFHFHRLFKAVTRLTPGEYALACHSLALQDTLGLDNPSTISGPRDINFSTQFPRWTPRSARKALGSLSPTDYAQGALSAGIKYTPLDDTAFGSLCLAWSRPPSRHPQPRSPIHPPATPPIRIHALLLGPSAEQRIQARFPRAERSVAVADGVGECVRTLADEGRDREGEVGERALEGVRRARVWGVVGRELGGGN